MSDGADKALARKGRMVGLVIAVTMLIWLGAQWAGPAMDPTGRYVFLIDFAALAALFWSMVVIFQMYRARQAQKDNQG